MAYLKKKTSNNLLKNMIGDYDLVQPIPLGKVE
jgi:hypothetical protein